MFTVYGLLIRKDHSFQDLGFRVCWIFLILDFGDLKL